MTIHPTALIDATATLADGVEVGPWCTVGPNVVLGEGVRLVSHVVVQQDTTVGAGTTIHPFAVIGGDPQHNGYKGEPVRLGPTEYRLLHFFISNPERVYTREQVLDRVWGQNVYVEERTVDVHIRRLRKALEPFGYDGMIQTVRGTGYRFSEQA